MSSLHRTHQVVTGLLLVVVALVMISVYGMAHTHAHASTSPIVSDERAIDSVRILSARGAQVPQGPAADLPDLAGVSPSQTPTPLQTATSTATKTATVVPTKTPTLTPAPPSATPTPTPPTRPFKYEVQSGDTLWDLADRFGIDVDSIVWSNERLEEDRDAISIGQELLIPPVTGALHTVAPGDTLTSIAAFYKVSMEAIAGYAANDLREPYKLSIGQVLVIPGGQKPEITRWVSTEKGSLAVNVPASKGRFVWPVTGMLTQFFSRTHFAIDIANHLGTPIQAAAAGVVTFVGEKSGGFGNAVMVDDGEGYSTLYSHLETFSVAVGDHVAQGQQLGIMGCTGLCTGPHLDFRIYYQGGAVNPMSYLP
jgi:murein DD-endopeptidase MepM/ murein hydrolase activator NlpD